MNEQIKKTLEPFKKFWGGTSPIVKRLIIGGIVVSVIVALIFSILLNSKDYVAIFDELTQTENQEILAKLQEMDVDAKYENGSIMVLKEDESRVRMALATEGYPKSGLSYYLIEQSSGVLTTDYERKQYVNMQLQERIAASIRTLDGVKDAVVTITTPSENGFYLQEKEKPTASVIIHMKQGSTLTESQILGIQNLVAKSVSGLSKDNIALSDGEGNDLLGNSVSNNAEYSKINVTREIENDIKKKILAVLEGPYDSSQIKISVSATVNTDALIREELTYIPSPDGNNSGVISEESREDESASSTQGNGGVPGTTTNSEVPTYPVGGSTGQSTSTRTSEDIKYQVSQTKSQSEKSGAVVETISIGIAIDKPFFDPGEQQSITQLVAFAAGVDPANVAVQNFKFQKQENTVVEEEPGINKMILYGAIAGGVLLILIGILVFIMLRRRRRALEEQALRESEALEKEAALNALFGEAQAEKIQHITPVQDVRREEIKEFAKENPEIAAQMIKSWLRNEE
ncbi:flagellar basal-body MS-ring/collar protein FliF [Sinanaerobacter chloroacetimidivorans]|jgi:flagellar M-ring protein FliF|uniref:Flagellar M-ring protein n=1 Tax=Sinanaerobacter chloroacetimidivorans TaxID=2818044 RepID=A0A8J7W1M0_9FIRM|nr:flagellar basal-body MS-ring/collar protein FliF [Sinanaerobacter chloroacetimidivorans]MBR0597528.1 flagellar M-ring protein FliF [Sinanaerobacter chloroacetimidivorans]